MDLGQHLRHAGFRLQNHLKAVELETAVVFVGDVGELDDFLVLGERARGAGVDRRSAARAGGKSDGAELHALAHHFFHGVELFGCGFAAVGGFAHDRQPNRRVGHERQTVDGDFAFEIVQIFAEGVPSPIFVVDIFVEHAAQILHENLARLGFRRHRRAGSAAVADDDARHAIVDHRVAVRILHDEGVHVRVRVDKSRRDHMSLGVDFFFAGA